MIYNINLNGSDWLFRGFIGEDWRLRKSTLPVRNDQRLWQKASVPGSVVNDLWSLDAVKNPYFECNTRELEWVSQRTWVYKKWFDLPQTLQSKRIQLCFHGVDYEASFFLNGEYLGDHRGMFPPVVFEVQDKLRFGGENLLAVVIDPAPQEEPQVGRTSRVKTHKSRMTYWWDFCPRLIHQGIWDDVTLEVSGQVRVEDIFVQTSLERDGHLAVLDLEGVVDAAIPGKVTLDLLIYKQDQVIAKAGKEISAVDQENRFTHQFIIHNPKLWQPNGCGEQPLYEAEVVVHTGKAISHQKRISFGIREVEFAKNDGAAEGALPYTLIVNGRKTYIKGWNWVPIDVLYGVSREEKLTRLITLAKEAHVNVLRVWGGGLIEKEPFYDLCDQHGIFIWQEFILSSSGIDNEPSTKDEYIHMLVDEAEEIIPHKRNHPSLLLWCGGNELQDSHGKPLDDTHATLAALKAVVNRLDPGRKWLPTSPSGRVFANNRAEIERDPIGLHDVHGPWEYQGVKEQYELYNHGASLLHSEFGVEGITNRRTLDAVIAPANQTPLSLEENPFWRHLGAWWVKRADWDKAFGELKDIESYIHATQFLQFDGMRYALEADRRRKYHNSGTLPWQFNEPYPMAACTSGVDYYGRPKPVYYAVKRAYEPVHVSVKHRGLIWKKGGRFQAEIWVNNSNLFEIDDAILKVRMMTPQGQVLKMELLTCNVPENTARRLIEFSGELSAQEEVYYLDVELRANHKETLSTNRYIFSCTENLDSLFNQSPARLSVETERDEDGWNLDIKNRGVQTAMFIWIEDDRPLGEQGYAYFSDNYFCLFPNEDRLIKVRWEGVAEGVRCLKLKGWNTEAFRIGNK